MTDPGPAALLVTGTVGSGKTTTAERIGHRLRLRGVPHAVVDLDALRQFWPTPDGDPFGLAMELRNLSCVAGHYLAAGVQRLILAGVCERRRDRERYRAVLGVPLAVCRLRVPEVELAARLRGRHVDDEAGLAWHLARAGELDAILDDAGVADTEVRTDGLTRDEVAGAVLQKTGW